MDTQSFFLTKNIADFPDEIVLPDIDEAAKESLKAVVSFSEALQNIQQLFELFLFKLDQLDNFCAMYYNDVILRKTDGSPASLIEVNALLINVISAGKTLVEGLANFLEIEISEDRARDFKTACISKKYDEVFSYRFLYYLRNFAQHGHLPVSRNPVGRFCFDLAQILRAKHIKASSSVKDSMERVYNEIIEKFEMEPRIAFTMTLDSYTLTVVEIYYNFLKEIEADARVHHEQLQTIFRQHPEWICRDGGPLNNMVIFDVEESMIHVLSAEGSFWNLFVEFKKQAKEKVSFFRKQHTEPGGENTIVKNV